MEISLENMCRTCMNENENMLSVYDAKTRVPICHNYAEMLMACAAVQVNEEDGLPQYICKQCMKQLIVAFTFKQQCEQSYATLREITKNPEIEYIKEEQDQVETCDSLSETELNGEPPSTMKMHLQTFEDDGDNNMPVKQEADVETDFTMTEEFLDDAIVLDDPLALTTASTKQEQSTGIALPLACCRPEAQEFLEDDIVLEELDDDFKPEACMRKSRRKPIEFVCSYCELKCRTKQALAKHVRMHTRIFTCELCGKQFRSAHGIAYHMKIHKGIKNYVCPYENCHRRFTLKQALEKHRSVHTQEKNYLCALCGKTFHTADALNYHLRTHKGERPYLCISCGKTFKQSCHLKSHMWVHNGIKPHCCKTCGKCYTSGHQLKVHIRKYCGALINKITAAI